MQQIPELFPACAVTWVMVRATKSSLEQGDVLKFYAEFDHRGPTAEFDRHFSSVDPPTPSSSLAKSCR